MLGQVIWIAFLGIYWIIFISNVQTFDLNAFCGMGFTGLLLTAPTILWYSRHAIGRKMRSSDANRSVRSVAASNEAMWGERNREYMAERQAQLAALYGSVPTAPARGMRATIHYNTFKMPVTETRYFEGVSADAQTGFDTRYSVDMILEFSEEERGIILQHALQTIVLDDKPRYSASEIADIRRADELRAESMGGRGELDLITKEIVRQNAAVSGAFAEGQRERTVLGDFLVAPYTKTFDESHDAKLYGEKLQSQILPNIKKLIESYRGHSDRPKTIEF